MDISLDWYRAFLTAAECGSITRAAEALYAALKASGLDVLYDDRPERAGVKFNDADLLGVPVRLTVSPRTLAQGAVEFKLRWETEPELVALEPLDVLLQSIRETCRP